MQLESEICLSPRDLIKKLIEKAEASYDVGGWFSSTGEKFYAKVYYANWSDKVIKGTSFLPSWTSYFLFRILGLSLWRRLFIGVYARLFFLLIQNQLINQYTRFFSPCLALMGGKKFMVGLLLNGNF